MGLAALNGVLAAAREEAQNTTDLGDRFERLCAVALRSHEGPNGKERFEHVWLWRDWPGCDGPDTGIDLVAQQTEEFGGTLCAIQCKFYKGKVSTQDVDSFIAASSRAEFSHRAIMHTGTGIQHHGAQKMRRAHPICEEFHLAEMGRWRLDWWQAASHAQAVDHGTPKKNVHANFGSFAKSKARGWWFGFWMRWFRTWRRVGWLRRVLLILQALLMIAVSAAAVAVAAAVVILVVVVTMIGTSKKPKKRRRKRS